MKHHHLSLLFFPVLIFFSLSGCGGSGSSEDEGEFAFTVVSNGPPAGEITVGKDESSCLDLTLTNNSGETLEIRDWEIEIEVTSGDADADSGDLLDETFSTTPNYTLIRLARVNDDGSIGGALLGPSELDTGGSDLTQTVVLDGSYNIASGETVNVSLVLDIAASEELVGDAIRCTLNDLTTIFDSVRDINGDSLGAESISPVADIVGNQLTVTGEQQEQQEQQEEEQQEEEEAEVDFTVVSNGPPAGEITVGKDESSCLDLTLTNNSGETLEIRDWEIEIEVTSGDADADSGDLLDETFSTTPNYTLIRLARVNDDGSIGGALLGPSELDTGGSDLTQTVVLDGSYNIASGETVNVSLVLDIAASEELVGDAIRCTLNDLTTIFDSVRDINGDSLGAESISPVADIVGNILTLAP